MHRACHVVEPVLASAGLLTRARVVRTALLKRAYLVTSLVLLCGSGCGDSVLVARELASEEADPISEDDAEDTQTAQTRQTTQDVGDHDFPIRGRGSKRWAAHGGSRDNRPRSPFTSRYAAPDAGSRH
jgi:hypothetical protein